jgi:hypothetical protein
VVELVNEIAATSSTTALRALHESVSAMRRSGPTAGTGLPGADRRNGSARSNDLALSLRALELAAEVAGSTTEQVNLALGEINALARRTGDAGEPQEAGRTLAEINQKIEGLRTALSATHAALETRSSA